MKIRKLTAFIVAILSLVATIAVLPASTAKVSAADPVVFVHSYNAYSLNYVLDKFFIPQVVQEGEEATVVADGYKYKATDDTTAWEDITVITGDHTFKCDASKTYDVKIFDGETEITGAEYIKANQFTLVKETSESDIYYSVTKEGYQAYNQAIQKALEGKKLNDYVTIPDLGDLFISNYFPFSALKEKLTVYHCKPTASSFTSSSSKNISLYATGTYSLYVVAQDPTGTAFTVDTEELDREIHNEIEGWYNEADELVCPIFTFTFTNVSEPEITIDSKVEVGFIGLTYNDAKDYITIVASNQSVKYELYYSATALEVSSTTGENWASSGVEVVKQSATNVTEDEDIAFNSSTLSFTPNKAGYYYVVVNVADDYGTDTAVTYGIGVHNEFKTVKYRTQWFKHNWLSVMFLGIAGLSGIGIILLIFVKPKEEKEEEITTIERK